MKKLTLILQSTRINEPLFILFLGLIIGLLGAVAIPLPFTPVPVSLRGFLILSIAYLFGFRRALFATFFCYALAFAGLPFFTGLTTLFKVGTLTGYQVGFIVGAYVVDLMKKWGSDPFKALSVGAFFILTMGTLFLSFSTTIEQALWLGFWPFVLTDAIKVVVFGLGIRSLKINL